MERVLREGNPMCRHEVKNDCSSLQVSGYLHGQKTWTARTDQFPTPNLSTAWEFVLSIQELIEKSEIIG